MRFDFDRVEWVFAIVLALLFVAASLPLVAAGILLVVKSTSVGDVIGGLLLTAYPIILGFMLVKIFEV